MTPSLLSTDRALPRKGGRTIHIVISTSRLHLSCREQFYSKFLILRIALEKDGGRKGEGGGGEGGGEGERRGETEHLAES